jgi:hypothetical protein
MTTRQYARLVSEWIASIGLDPLLFGTHSLRRTKATLIYRRTGNLRAVQILLGHTKIDYVPCRTMSRCGNLSRSNRVLMFSALDIAILLAGQPRPTRLLLSEESPVAIVPTTSSSPSSKASEQRGLCPDCLSVRIDYKPDRSATGHSPARDIVHTMSRGT